MLRTSLLLPFAVVACVDAQPEYQFGLTGDELLEIKRVAVDPPSDADWLAAHTGDFDCGRYGDLCTLVGPDEAYRVIELGYLLALDGADRDAIADAQDAAIATARPAWEANPLRPVPRATNTGFFYGGSTNKRLKVEAHATEMWPSLELRATGECTFQKNSFGWLPSEADEIHGVLQATFSTSSGSERLQTATRGTNVKSLNLPTTGRFQRAADHLTTDMYCSASEGLWDASGTVIVTF